MLQKVLEALQKMRSPFALYETELHHQVEAALTAAGLPCRHEAPIATRYRIDFLVGTVGVEIKKGKPNATALRAQLQRYAASDLISAIVVVTSCRISLPETIGGKPVVQVSLNCLWGVALP